MNNSCSSQCIQKSLYTQVISYNCQQVLLVVLASTDIPYTISMIASYQVIAKRREARKRRENIKSVHLHPCSIPQTYRVCMFSFFHFFPPRRVDSALACKHTINREESERELTCKREARQLPVPQGRMLLPHVMCRSRRLSIRKIAREACDHI